MRDQTTNKQTGDQQAADRGTLADKGGEVDELEDQALEAAVGGSLSLFQACCTGKHIPQAKIGT
jgi:hypothetical protein